MHRLFSFTILAAIGLAGLPSRGETAPSALASAYGKSAYRLVSPTGDVAQLQAEEGLVFEDDIVETSTDGVTLDSARGERLLIGQDSRVSYGVDPTPTVALESGELYVFAGATRDLVLEAAGLQIAMTNGEGDANYYAKAAPGGAAAYVYNYGADLTIGDSSSGVTKTLSAEQGAWFAVAGSDVAVKMLQDEPSTMESEDEDDTKRPLIKTVYREMKVDYVLVEDDEKEGLLNPGESLEDVDILELQTRKAERAGWRLENGLLESDANTDSDPLPLVIPVKGLTADRSTEQSEEDLAADYADETEGDDREGTFWVGPHYVRAHVRTGPEFRGTVESGFPQPALNSFDARFEENDEFETYYYDPSDANANYESGRPNTKYYDPNQPYSNEDMLDLGTVDLSDGVLDVVIDDGTSPFWTSIYGLDFTPIGIWWSPDETTPEEIGEGVGDEAIAAEEERDIFGVVPAGSIPIIIGGTVVVIGAGIPIIGDITDDDSDDDDDGRRPFSPTGPGFIPPPSDADAGQDPPPLED